MDPPSQSIQDIFLGDDDANPTEDGNEAKRKLVTLAQEAPAKKRRCYNPRKTRTQWDQVKADVEKLYVDEDRSLEETMTELETNRGFEASKDQFKSKIKEWKFDKKVKTQEMKHILRIESTRFPKKTAFKVRNQPVSRNKIERFKNRQSACPEPPSRTPSAIGYETSYSPEGTPSSNLIVSPRLGNVEWYRSYKDHRNSPPGYLFHPVFQKLQKLRLPENTYELQMFNQLKFEENSLIMEEVFSRNLIAENSAIRGEIGEDSTTGGKNDCTMGCTFMVMHIYDVCRTTYDNDPGSLSAEPNLQCWVSEIARLFQSKIESINIHIMRLAMDWSFDNRYANAVNVFYEVGLEMCRAKKSDDWRERHEALDMVDSLILRGRVRAGETLLRAIMKENFNIIDTPCQNHVPHPKWHNEPMQSLYWRRGTFQLNVIRWFLAHPDLTQKIFGDDDIPEFSLGTFRGLKVNNLVLCFAVNEDWTEDDRITVRLFKERDCAKYLHDRMFIPLGLSLYLPRYGRSALRDRYQKGFVETEDENEDTNEDEDDDTEKDEDGMMSVERDTAPESNLGLADGNSFTGQHVLGLSSGEYIAQIGQLGTEGEGTKTNVEPSAEQWVGPFLGNLTSADQWNDLFFEQITQAGFVPEETQPILEPSAGYENAPPNFMPVIPGPQVDYQNAPPNFIPMIPGPQVDWTQVDYQNAPSNFMPMIPGPQVDWTQVDYENAPPNFMLMIPGTQVDWTQVDYQNAPPNFIPIEPGPQVDFQNAPSNSVPMIPGPQIWEQVPGWNSDSEPVPVWHFGSKQIPDWDVGGEQTRLDTDPDVGLEEASSGVEWR
ncbi:MAG: hypothetical protein Q9209_004470 [Squamulea sp. 1 TL-2023]